MDDEQKDIRISRLYGTAVLLGGAVVVLAGLWLVPHLLADRARLCNTVLGAVIAAQDARTDAGCFVANFMMSFGRWAMAVLGGLSVIKGLVLIFGAKDEEIREEWSNM